MVLPNKTTFYDVLDKWIKEAIEYKRQGIITELSDWYKPLLERYFALEIWYKV